MARRWHGLVQMGVSAAGVVMVLIGFAGYFARYYDTLERPGWGDAYANVAVGGAALFALTWFWALISSLFILRSAVRPPPRLA